MVFVLLIGIGVMGVMMVRRPATAEPVDSPDLTIDVPPGHQYGGPSFGRQLDISPDGNRIVYVGSRHKGNRQLFVHTIGETEPAEIPGAEVGNRDIRDPTFSPDGRYVAYWAQGIIKKTTLDGTTVSVIGNAPSTRGIGWLDSETLVLGNPEGDLLKLSAGKTSALVKSTGSILPHVSPNILPGNKAVLFTLADGPLINARIQVLILETGEERQLFDENAYAPRYLTSGHLVFGRGPTRELMAVRFDLSKLEIVGSAQPVLSVPLSGTGTGGSTDYAVSQTGVVAYTPYHEASINDTLAWFGGIPLTKIHVRLKWFEELNRSLP